MNRVDHRAQLQGDCNNYIYNDNHNSRYPDNPPEDEASRMVLARNLEFQSSSSAKQVSGSSDQPNNIMVSDSNTKGSRQRCRFFFSSQGCANGEHCAYSHDVAAVEVKNPQSQVMPQPSFKPPACRFFAAGYCKWGNRCGFYHETLTHTTQPSKAGDKQLSLMSNHELRSVRKTEIDQLKKRFPRRHDQADGIHRIVFRPSDPDWPYEVRDVPLEMKFPEWYPKDRMLVTLSEPGRLPATLISYLERKMDEWIVEEHLKSTKADKCSLMFRPFLRWLDRHLENLFTEGLSIYKRQLAASAAGLKFIHHEELRAKPIEHSCGDNDLGTPMQTPNLASLSMKDADTVLAGANVNIESPDNGHLHTVDPTTEGSSSASNSSLEVGDAHSSGSDDGAESDEEKQERQPACSVNREQEQNVRDSGSSATGKVTALNPMKRGTELKLRGLQLLESCGTLHSTVLRTGLRCLRCKTVHHISAHSEKPYAVVCDKCRTKMALIYHANLMHSMSNTMGYFDTDGCVLFDLILQDCHFIASCVDCSKEMPIHGLHQEQPKQFWCLGCHKRMSIVVEKGSFVKLNQGAAIKLGADAVLIAKKAKLKSEVRILQDGKPLPDFGACQHFKKSFRWFRFSCCGKLYPCDLCHNEKELDHEMQLATRMVCGYCSKEQAFTNAHPCVQCDSSMTRAKSIHWEGGKGCRNKVAMSRNDKQKFSGVAKTISNKASAEMKKAGQK